MNRYIAQLSLVVRDYDEALAFYTGKLDFTVVEDTVLSPSKRWVVITPPGNGSCRLLLARAATPEQSSRIGNQTGGRVFLFLYTDDFQRDFDQLVSRQVTIVRPPSREPYGMVAVFSDLYGNLWDLIEPASALH